jgi:hypothetical protein
LRRFKKHHVIGTLLPNKEISILPEKFLTDSEEKLWQEKVEQFRQAASFRMNALLSELEYVQLKAGYYMAQETAAREKWQVPKLSESGLNMPKQYEITNGSITTWSDTMARLRRGKPHAYLEQL